MKRHSWTVYLGMASVVGFVLLWVAFGCYGLYAFFAPSLHNTRAQRGLSQVFHWQSGRATADNEIVIRLVREVVHVDQKGIILDRTPEQTQLSRERIDKISQCVSDAVLE